MNLTEDSVISTKDLESSSKEEDRIAMIEMMLCFLRRILDLLLVLHVNRISSICKELGQSTITGRRCQPEKPVKELLDMGKAFLRFFLP